MCAISVKRKSIFLFITKTQFVWPQLLTNTDPTALTGAKSQFLTIMYTEIVVWAKTFLVTMVYDGVVSVTEFHRANKETFWVDGASSLFMNSLFWWHKPGQEFQYHKTLSWIISSVVLSWLSRPLFLSSPENTLHLTDRWHDAALGNRPKETMTVRAGCLCDFPQTDTECSSCCLALSEAVVVVVGKGVWISWLCHFFVV